MEVGCGGNVNVCPSVVNVEGVVRPVGAVNVSDPMMMTPELEITVCPSGSVKVVGRSGGAVVCEVGRKVKVWSSVVTVVRLVRPVGAVKVSDPIMITPELDITVCPSGSVNVVGRSGGDVLCELDGRNVKVWPSVVTVVGLVRPVGAVKLSDPMIITPELEITVCPSGSVNVVGRSGGEVVWELGGRKVKVSPSVVSTVGLVRPVGTVTVSDPMMIRPELEITV